MAIELLTLSISSVAEVSGMTAASLLEVYRGVLLDCGALVASSLKRCFNDADFSSEATLAIFNFIKACPRGASFASALAVAIQLLPARSVNFQILISVSLAES